MDFAAMNHETIRAGLNVRTATTLDPWNGMGDPGTRRGGAAGRVLNAMPHQAAGAWCVRHEDGSTGTYLAIELTPAPVAGGSRL